MAVSTNYKRLFIQGLFWDSEDNGVSLYDTLKAASRARLTDTKTGKVLTGTGRNGATVSFSLPIGGAGNLTPLYVAEMCAEMLTRYADATAQLAADGNTEPSDQDILNEILDDLTPRTESYGDYIDLRIASLPRI